MSIDLPQQAMDTTANLHCPSNLTTRKVGHIGNNYEKYDTAFHCKFPQEWLTHMLPGYMWGRNKTVQTAGECIDTISTMHV